MSLQPVANPALVRETELSLWRGVRRCGHIGRGSRVAPSWIGPAVHVSHHRPRKGYLFHDRSAVPNWTLKDMLRLLACADRAGRPRFVSPRWAGACEGVQKRIVRRNCPYSRSGKKIRFPPWSAGAKRMGGGGETVPGSRCPASPATVAGSCGRIPADAAKGNPFPSFGGAERRSTVSGCVSTAESMHRPRFSRSAMCRHDQTSQEVCTCALRPAPPLDASRFRQPASDTSTSATSVGVSDLMH
jgi:hypothetical protein